MGGFFTAESTGRATENIDEAIQGNMEMIHGERLAREGTIGPIPEDWKEFPKNIFGNPAPPMSEEDMTALAMGTAGAGPANLGKGMLKFLKKMWRRKALLRDVSGRSVSASIKNIPKFVKKSTISYLNTSKPYQQMRQKFKKWDQPPLSADDPLFGISNKTKAAVTKDIAGERGLDRLFHTLDATNAPVNNPRVRAAIQDAIEMRVGQTEIGAVPKTYNLKETLKGSKGQRIGGRAYTHETPRAKVEFQKGGRAGRDPEWLESVGKHEFTHVGQMQTNVGTAKWMDDLIKKHKLTGDEMSWMRNNVFGRQKRPVGGVSTKNPNSLEVQRWEEKYMEKIYPELKPHAKEWYDKYMSSKQPYWKMKGKDMTNEYFLRPRELAARASEMRYLIDKMNKSGEPASPLLTWMAKREGRFLTDKGLDMTINKLWGLGPLGLAIDQHIDADKNK